ncbi:MAG: hypothetical protein QOF83_388 [Solirubrobacteraceae bacterium]|jgi:hypothetical protein|nr:hypothetical protein [Solirubrobacteraceae bacterium]
MSESDSRRGRWAFWLTIAGLAWSAALVAGAFMLLAYGSSGTSSTGAHWSGSVTLVAVNGAGVLAPVGIPLLISTVVWFALHRKCSRGGPIAGYVAWTLVAVLALGCLVAAASIGLLIVPVVLLLGRAAALTPSAPASAQAA